MRPQRRRRRRSMLQWKAPLPRKKAIVDWNGMRETERGNESVRERKDRGRGIEREGERMKNLHFLNFFRAWGKIPRSG